MVASVGRRSVGRRLVVGRSCFWRRSVVGRGGRKGVGRSFWRGKCLITCKKVGQKKALKCAMRCVFMPFPLTRNRKYFPGPGGGRARRSGGGRAGGRRAVGGLSGGGRACCRRSLPELSWLAACCRWPVVGGRSLRGGVRAENRRRCWFCGALVGRCGEFWWLAIGGGRGAVVGRWRCVGNFFGRVGKWLFLWCWWLL